MRPILIVGAGPAGLALARSLFRRGVPFQVFDSQTDRAERGLGMWGRSQVALRSLGLGGLLDDASKTVRIPAAAYRSHSGTWLSASSDTPENLQQVCSLRESHLLAALADGLPKDAVRRGMSLVAANVASDGVALSFDDGSRVEGAAVVGADGARSAVRRLAFASSSQEATDIGFGVHSGVLASVEGDSDWARAPSGAGAPPRPFETLARGRRFAMVPLADGGAFWFASQPLAGDCFNGHRLRDAYADWHAPIPQALHAAIMDESVVASGGSSATGSGGANGGSTSGADGGSTSGADGGSTSGADGGSTSGADGGSTSGAIRWERVYAAPVLTQWHDGRVVLVGDAAHAMSHNLAQGAACAIEGAYLLGEAIGDVAASAAGVDADDGPGLEAAFAAYHAAHAPRVAQCRVTTHFTAALAIPASPASEAVRNAMALVPQPINSMVFDAALAVSLGDIPASTRARWPLGSRDEIHKKH